ncbi:MAG: hypothetical protein Q7S16_04010 [bacterium]|nr:hypothetical protein [bacterium]
MPPEPSPTPQTQIPENETFGQRLTRINKTDAEIAKSMEGAALGEEETASLMNGIRETAEDATSNEKSMIQKILDKIRGKNAA